MEIQIKKGRDGLSTLTCVRADGSRTWNKLHPFFPIHDLTHCAVESVFGFDQAFFGLIAAGRGIDEFAEPGAAKRLPPQALIAEFLVGLFDLERGEGRYYSAEEFNRGLGAKLTEFGMSFRPVGDAELSQVRELRDTLGAQWYGLDPGATLRVTFPASIIALNS